MAYTLNEKKRKERRERKKRGRERKRREDKSNLILWRRRMNIASGWRKITKGEKKRKEKDKKRWVIFLFIYINCLTNPLLISILHPTGRKKTTRRGREEKEGRRGKAEERGGRSEEKKERREEIKTRRGKGQIKRNGKDAQRTNFARYLLSITVLFSFWIEREESLTFLYLIV